MSISARLPVFPWDRLEPYKAAAAAHPDGVVDLSVGTPVDPVPDVIRRALVAAADSPGYPLTYGTAALRESAARYLRDRHGVAGADPAAVLPLIGSKELVALLPLLLDLREGDQVGYPDLAYPTYEIGALIARAEPVPYGDPVAELDPARVRVLWLNSPSNPTGRVLAVGELRRIVEWARRHGVLVVSDECYIELGWEGAEPVSVLRPEVCGDSHDGLVAVHSLSKRSNFAGYRGAFLAGDPAVVRELLGVRKHAGMIVPQPVQAAMAAALDDRAHAVEQKERYRRRRADLRAALEGAGFRIEHSEASLYLWATRDEGCWETVGDLAKRGIVVAPGEFYGPAGARFVRVALTATDERVAAAVDRLAG
ncbi:succinyldiaminopimelate transaminase [Actinacidiphila sp. ITFR-21]|uniref:succinyldiaminopimelate transaminase n=1 Tax=Actinacidiphila sp. ITFR-21 TaxID=3075199 RepID=UPI002889C756|nr:succinyldiaminopimelate transaminase [Streptomyces sp. ITFR-21]WNI17550.1 succinyldiaminopimelate transaminase [Streptomyces sp. ITFR-21]